MKDKSSTSVIENHELPAGADGIKDEFPTPNSEPVPWQYLAAMRVKSGIDQKISELCTKKKMADEYLRGWLPWFEQAHPAHFKKWWEAWMKMNDTSIPEAAYHEALRIYRDGALWCMERYIEHRKKQQAEAMKPAQSRLAV